MGDETVLTGEDVADLWGKAHIDFCLDKYESFEEALVRLAEQRVLAKMGEKAQNTRAERDRAFEAVRKAFCALQRFSFLKDASGAVRKVPDDSGNWVNFYEVHEKFVDACLACEEAAERDKAFLDWMEEHEQHTAAGVAAGVVGGQAQVHVGLPPKAFRTMTSGDGVHPQTGEEIAAQIREKAVVLEAHASAIATLMAEILQQVRVQK